MKLADLIKKGSLRGFATATPATPATPATDKPCCLPTVATVAVAKGPNTPAVNEPAAAMPDPDRWAWPHSMAMNGLEIDTFTARLHHFTRHGLASADAEKMADSLVMRDRDADERRLCLECVHLAGHAAGAWGCKNWQRAGVAVRARDAQLSAALVYQPQRCDGFAERCE